MAICAPRTISICPGSVATRDDSEGTGDDEVDAVVADEVMVVIVEDALTSPVVLVLDNSVVPVDANDPSTSSMADCNFRPS